VCARQEIRDSSSVAVAVAVALAVAFPVSDGYLQAAMLSRMAVMVLRYWAKLLPSSNACAGMYRSVTIAITNTIAITITITLTEYYSRFVHEGGCWIEGLGSGVFGGERDLQAAQDAFRMAVVLERLPRLLSSASHCGSQRRRSGG